MAEPGSDLASVAGWLTGGNWTHPTGLSWRRSGCCDSLPVMPDGSDIDALKAALAAAEAEVIDARAKATEAEARAANAVAKVSDAEAQIATLKLMIEKLRRALFGQRSERKQRLLDQLELQLDELEASATEDELAAEQAAADTTQVKAFTRRRRSGRKPFPEHLPRERVVVPAPSACECCGSQKLSKIGEDITETLEVVPRQWEGHPDRAGEVHLPPLREDLAARRRRSMPFAAWLGPGPNLLAMILSSRSMGQHQPLNRQRDRYAREGVDLSLSTLADQVGACTVALKPLHDLIAEPMCWRQERLHGDDTPVARFWPEARPRPGRAWVYVRDDRPFGGPDPPAALLSATRGTARAIIRSNICAATPASCRPMPLLGYNRLYEPGRSPGPVTEAACFAHARRKFYELADIAASKGRGKRTCHRSRRWRWRR